MKLYGGIDLHSNNSVIALLDEEDKPVYPRRLPNDLSVILGELAPYREAIAGLVVESTYNWYWLVDALMEAGYRVHLANTAAIVQYAGLKYSDDDSDARLAGEVAAPGAVAGGLHLPQGGAGGARSAAPAQPVGPAAHGQCAGDPAQFGYVD